MCHRVSQLQGLEIHQSCEAYENDEARVAQVVIVLGRGSLRHNQSRPRHVKREYLIQPQRILFFNPRAVVRLAADGMLAKPKLAP